MKGLDFGFWRRARLPPERKFLAPERNRLSRERNKLKDAGERLVRSGSSFLRSGATNQSSGKSCPRMAVACQSVGGVAGLYQGVKNCGAALPEAKSGELNRCIKSCQRRFQIWAPSPNDRSAGAPFGRADQGRESVFLPWKSQNQGCWGATPACQAENHW